MANIVVALIILFILGLSIYKIVLEKKKGMKCVGCPLSGNCSSNKQVFPSHTKQPKNKVVQTSFTLQEIPINNLTTK